MRRIDANLLVRYLTDDPPDQAARATPLIRGIISGDERVVIEEVTTAEVVWVLRSVYGVARHEIALQLRRLLANDGFVSPSKLAIDFALALYHDLNVDFSDALIAAKTLADGESEVYSYDRDFDRIPGIVRREP